MSPDTFYFRVTPMSSYAAEVSDALARRASSGASGPSLSFRNSQALYDKGTLTLIGEESDVRDQDRVGREFIEFYNNAAQGFETYLQAVQGRVIGDRDGQFKFFLAPDDQPGGTDPVTGELLPYYANPDGTGDKPTPAQIDGINILAQEGFVRNSIDDVVLKSRKPFTFTFPLTFEYQGTFVRAWEASRISRFYPQRSLVVTITPPDRDNSGDYGFFDDFGTTLGDLQQDDVLSLESLERRSAQGWLITPSVSVQGSEATLEVGIVNELGDTAASNPGPGQNLTDGDVNRKIPGYAVNDLMNLGRVEYVPNPATGLVERTETVYAQNMVVTSVSGDSVTLGRLDQNYFDTNYPGSGITFASLNITVTDPSTLDGGSPAAGYSAATSLPKQNDTLFGTSLNAFREGFDFGLDASEGELINRSLPDFLATLTGQNAPEPLTYLNATISYKNQRTEPFRFPALDGESLNDDGLQVAPYGYPLLDSEIVSLGVEEAANLQVQLGTTQGLVLDVSRLDGSTLTTTQDLTDISTYPSPPRPYDMVLLEGETAGGSPATGGNTPFSFSAATATEIKLAAFPAYDVGVTYTIADAFAGTGTGSGVTWTDDLGRDFTVLNGLTGVLDIGGSLFTIVSFGVGTLQVAAGPLPASGAFNLDLAGSGTVSNLHALTDVGTDFTLWSEGLTLTVTSGVNTGSYLIAKGVGSDLEPETIPVGFGPGNAAILSTSIEVQGTGIAQGITPSLFEVVGVDFTPYGPSSTLFILDTNVNGDVTSVESHDVVTFANQSLDVTPDVTNTGVASEFYLAEDPLVAIGDAAIDILTDASVLFVVTDLGTQDIRAGDVLVIPPTEAQSGRYLVQEVNTTSAPYARIIVEETFTASAGDITNGVPVLDSFPVRFTVSRPRRFSDEVLSLQDSLLQRRVVYDTVANAPTTPVDIQALLTVGGYEVQNPAGPSLGVITSLIDTTFDETLASASDGTIVDLGGGVWALESLGSDFITQGVSDDTDSRASFILIEDGNARGFYRVGEVLSSTQLRLRNGSEFSVDFIAGLSAESGLTFTVLRGDRFSERTYELVLYEFSTVKEILDRLDQGIQATLHDSDAFVSLESLVREPGDPIDATLALHQSGAFTPLPAGIQDRLSFLTASPSLVDEIEAILSGTENLYDLRFAWIDFRLNLENGTLPTRRRLRQTRAKRQRDLLRNLLRI